VTTYTGANLTGTVSSISSLTFDCTTGVVQSAPASRTSDIPSLSPVALALTAALLLVAGFAALRRLARQRSR